MRLIGRKPREGFEPEGIRLPARYLNRCGINGLRCADFRPIENSSLVNVLSKDLPRNFTDEHTTTSQSVIE
jgi:hypothetical protein